MQMQHKFQEFSMRKEPRTLLGSKNQTHITPSPFWERVGVRVSGSLKT
jgi:hypothetical protein